MRLFYRLFILLHFLINLFYKKIKTLTFHKVLVCNYANILLNFTHMFALVDCNNFYASCERVFNPNLIGKPVAILSNNDGCVISRMATVSFGKLR